MTRRRNGTVILLGNQPDGELALSWSRGGVWVRVQMGGFVTDEQVPKSPSTAGQVQYNQQLGRVISTGGAPRVENGFLTNGG
jgi:hypothetical protein